MTLDADHAAAPPEPAEPDRGPDAAAADIAAEGEADPAGEVRVPAQPPRRRVGGSAGLLGAAMLAVGEILEPEKTKVEIVQTDDEPLDDLPFGIDFGDLPPLD